MRDDELGNLLASADGPIEPPVDLVTRVRSEMIEELQRFSIADSPRVAVSIEEWAPVPAMRHWPLRVATAIVVAATVVALGIVAVGRTSTDLASQTPSAAPDYARACVDFRDSTTVGTDPWYQVVPNLQTDDPAAREYLDSLAAAVEQVAETERAEPARAVLFSVAQLSRSPSALAELTEIASQLDAAQRLLATSTGFSCLDDRVLGGGP